MIDQPMPSQGNASVTPVARDAFADMLDGRERRGIETYGMSLQTHNGRNAYQDAMEEAVDLWQYLIQARMEHDDLVDIVRPMVLSIVDAAREAEYSLDGVPPAAQMFAFISAGDVLRLAAMLGVKP